MAATERSEVAMVALRDPSPPDSAATAATPAGPGSADTGQESYSSIAIDYRRLPVDATLKDIVVGVCVDGAHHRDVKHFASDIHFQGMELKETPAPLEYH